MSPGTTATASGPPVVEAARLEAAAEPGQILCSEFVRVMARGRGNHHFDELGPLDLKGLAGPLSACVVLWDAPDHAALSIPLSGNLTRSAQLQFVAREQELSLLRRLIAEPRTTVAWIAGEPGIGKTRLAAEAATDQPVVLFGRASQDLGLPLQPIIEALRSFTQSCPPDRLQGSLGDHPEELRRLLPDLDKLLPDLGAPIEDSSDSGRYRLFEAIRSWLVTLASTTPTLVVLDDLHWAGEQTVGLLGHLVQSADEVPLTVVATVRDTDPHASPAVAALLDELASSDCNHVIELDGLDVDAVSSLVRSRQADLDAAELIAHASHVRERTGGNAFFITTVLADDGSNESDIARAVRRRLGGLDDEVRALLATAALVGLEFDLPVVATTLGMDDVRALDHVETAVRAALVDEAGVNTFRFAHALVRDGLSDEIGPSRRARTHAQIGAAIESVHAGRLDQHVAALAHHYGRAADAGLATDRARHWLGELGRQALSHTAYVEADGYLRRALSFAESATEAERAALLCDLGEAQWKSASVTDGLDTLVEAAELAAGCGDAETLGRAAWETEDAAARWGLMTDEVADLVERALAAIGPEQTPRRCRMLGALARTSFLVGRSDRAREAYDEAVALAGRLDDPLSSVYSLGQAYQLTIDPSSIRERLKIGRQLRTIAARARHPQVDLGWRPSLGFAAYELGLGTEARAAMDPYAALARRLGDRAGIYVGLLFASTDSLSRGRTSLAEELASQASELAQSSDGAYGMQMFSIRREQGRLAEARPVLEMLARQGTEGAWLPGLALLYIEVGEFDAARTTFDQLAASDFEDLPHDARRSLTLAYLAEVCAAIGDRVRAERLYELIEPYDGLIMWMVPTASAGPAGRYLGMLAALLGEHDKARAHFEDALDLADCIDGVIWRNRIERELAALP